MLAALTALDRAVFLAINHDLVRYHLDKPMQLLGRIGTGGAVWFGLFLLIFILGGRRGRRLAITGAVAVILALLISDGILKGLVERPRPFDPTQLGHLARVVGARPTGFSFPSGDAAAAFAAASILGRRGGTWAWLAWILAVLIAFSRVYVGAHFPLDVLGGVVVGLFAAWLAMRILGDPAARRR